MPSLRKTMLGFVIAVLWGTAACSSLTPVTTHSPLPSIVEATTVPSTSIWIPTSTITPRPSNTATIIPPTWTQAPNPEATLTAQATNSYATQVASFPIACTKDIVGTMLSPQGDWLAVSCGFIIKDQTLEIVRKDGKRWVLKLKDYMDGPDEASGSLYPVHWKNDNFLYFTSNFYMDGAYSCFYTYGSRAVYRIDLNNGTVSPVIRPVRSYFGFTYEFSPDGRWLAYFGDNPAILDLQTGEAIQMNSGLESVGDFTWSPDGLQIAFSTCRSGELTKDGNTVHDFPVDSSSLQIYDLKTRTLKTIYEVKGKQVRIQQGEDGISVMAYSDYKKPDYFLLDWSSDELIAITPTPAP